MGQITVVDHLVTDEGVIANLSGVTRYTFAGSNGASSTIYSAIHSEGNTTALQVGGAQTFTFVAMRIQRIQGSSTDANVNFGYSDTNVGFDSGSVTNFVGALGASGGNYLDVPSVDGQVKMIMLPRFVVPANKYPTIATSNGGATFNWAGMVWGILA